MVNIPLKTLPTCHTVWGAGVLRRQLRTARFFATNRRYVRTWPCLAGQGDGRARRVSSTTHRASGRLCPAEIAAETRRRAGRRAFLSHGVRGARRFWEHSCEGDAHPFLFSPDDVAGLANIACCEVDGNFARNTCGAWYVKRSSGRRQVADGAFDALALELNRSGLEHTLASCCASFCHHQPSLRPKNLSI